MLPRNLSPEKPMTSLKKPTAAFKKPLALPNAPTALSNAPSALAALALCLSLAALPALAVTPVGPVYSIAPTSTAADKAFTLTLLGGSFGCGATFSRESVVVADKRIDLSFVANIMVMIDQSLVLIDQPLVLKGAATDSATRADVYCPVYDTAIQLNAMPIYGLSLIHI